MFEANFRLNLFWTWTCFISNCCKNLDEKLFASSLFHFPVVYVYEWEKESEHAWWCECVFACGWMWMWIVRECWVASSCVWVRAHACQCECAKNMSPTESILRWKFNSLSVKVFHQKFPFDSILRKVGNKRNEKKSFGAKSFSLQEKVSFFLFVPKRRLVFLFSYKSFVHSLIESSNNE